MAFFAIYITFPFTDSGLDTSIISGKVIFVKRLGPHPHWIINSMKYVQSVSCGTFPVYSGPAETTGHPDGLY